ncbi:MAG: phage tail assembly protein [Syntrophorhabdaceae bacterium]|nr:phage tail assembly protein [Syntrophorhabdaceae bacterium]
MPNPRSVIRVQLADRLLVEITMRRPTMRDHPIKGLMNLLGSLCGLRLEEIERMDMADYRKVTDAFDRFRY